MRKSITAIFTCLAFVAFSQNIDLRILRSVNQTDHKLWDESMRVTSDGIYPFMVISPAAIWLTGYVNKDEVMKRNGVKTVVAIGATLLITEGLKESIRRPRPYSSAPDDVISRCKTSGFSFP